MDDKKTFDGKKLWLALLGALAFATLAFWQGEGRAPTPLEEIRSKGKLVVLTRYSPTIYYEGPEGPAGYEYEMAKMFAEYLGVGVEIRVLDSVSSILAGIRNGEGDIAAAGLTKTEHRAQTFLFGSDYFSVRQQVVCHRSVDMPKDLSGLGEVELLVSESSSYAEKLSQLQREHPELRWKITSDYSTEQILELVAEKRQQCTVADSNVVSINKRYFPQLTVAFSLSEEQELSWILRDEAKGLQGELADWFASMEQFGGAAKLYDRYYGYGDIFNYVDLSVFHKHMKSRLPIYEEYFQGAAEQNNLPFDLLAAQGYQESHWNPRAKSPTGVRGIMMLTLTTAKAVGVKSRLDAVQSIYGGAKYLSRVLKGIPKSVQGDDRLKFALAAYNVGLGHLRDARQLASRLGKNPDTWEEMKTVLPLLSQKKYYKTVKHGYARGTEPVNYVERIISFRDIIRQKYYYAMFQTSEVVVINIPAPIR
ncbi:MAG: membrane-bound lytic murein transglycosylase MltF [Desulfobulbaceae bacterium]|nr:membrane-bound lytic murein transglycosylase MltF [Desulfobulbaceae bacterium]